MGRIKWTDEDILTVLDLRDHAGMTTVEIAQRFGVGKGAIIGMLNCINKETDALDPDGNQNGTMPRKWWERSK